MGRFLASSKEAEASDTSFFFFQSDYAEEAYDRVAWELGLERERTFFTRCLTGEIDGLFVGIYGHKNGTIDEVLVDSRGIVSDRLSIAPANPTSPFRGLRTADEGFDARVYAMGPEAETLALLGHDTRKMLMDVVATHGAEVEKGRVRLGAKAAAKILRGRVAGEVDGKTLARFVRRMIELAKRLAMLMGGDTEERLAHNVECDERAGVRRKNLALLISRYGETVHARAAARSVLAHFDYELRLDAAAFLADRDLTEVVHLEALFAEQRAPTSVRLSALMRILTRLEGEPRTLFIRRVLRSDDDAGRTRALAFCRQYRIDPGESLLADLLDHRDPETVAATCGLVAALGQTTLVPALIRALRYDTLEVKCNAAAALGAIGGREAVSPLRRVVQGLVDAELRRIAREALDKIRSRLEHAPGGLSFTDDTTSGTLSLTGETATLSLPPDK